MDATRDFVKQYSVGMAVVKTMMKDVRGGKVGRK